MYDRFTDAEGGLFYHGTSIPKLILHWSGSAEPARQAPDWQLAGNKPRPVSNSGELASPELSS